MRQKAAELILEMSGLLRKYSSDDIKAADEILRDSKQLLELFQVLSLVPNTRKPSSPERVQARKVPAPIDVLVHRMKESDAPVDREILRLFNVIRDAKTLRTRGQVLSFARNLGVQLNDEPKTRIDALVQVLERLRKADLGTIQDAIRFASWSPRDGGDLSQWARIIVKE